MQNNPFDIPNMGLDQDNPLFSSLTMMGKMWENMAQHPMHLSSTDPKELDKRISELKAIENWLRLNLSMLSSTIQGLEIQRSTLSTLQQFAQQGFTGFGLPETPKVDASTAGHETQSSQSENMAANESVQQAGQAWWGLIQQQFDSLAQATAQSMQQAQEAAETMSSTMAAPSADTTMRKKTATKKTTKTAAKSAKKAAKKTAKKTTPNQ